MGRDVCGVFEHGRREPGEMPAAFAEACAALAARWGLQGDGTGLVRVTVEDRVVIAKPAPRWLGFAELGDLRELCRVITWAVGVAYDRRSPVLFVTDSFVSDAPPVTVDKSLAWVQHCEGPSADPFWASRYVHLFGRPSGAWLLDSLDDIDDASPLARYRSILEGWQARGGMRLGNGSLPYASETRWPEVLPTDGEIRVCARAPGAEREAPIWSGLLTASVGGTDFHQFRDVYTGNTLGDDPIEAAIDLACKLGGGDVMIHLVALDVCSAEILVTKEQVRRLAQVGASLDVTVSLDGSG